MKVLVTGASGLLGKACLQSLIENGHTVRAFDIRMTGDIKKIEKSYSPEKIELWCGDIRNKDEVKKALDGCEVVVHLAFVLPPLSETKPQFAYAVNVEGSMNLIEAIKQMKTPPKIIFASTFCVLGVTQDLTPPVDITFPVKPYNNYTSHKVKVEKEIVNSGINFTILRFAIVMSPSMKGKIDPIVFEFPFDMRVEFIHSKDAGLAVARCLDSKEVWGKILMIGAGKKGQTTYGTLINGTLEAMGIGKLPKEAFSPYPIHGGDWIDTGESQKFLDYQRHGFEEYLEDVRKEGKMKIHVTKLISPLLRWLILQKSPFYKKQGLPLRERG